MVVAIIGILAMMITGNFFTALRKGRDTKRKSDLNATQKAIEDYYEDNKVYPDVLDFAAAAQLCHPEGCNTKIYMRLPTDPTTCQYRYVHETADGEGYALYSALENIVDQSAGVNQAGYSGVSCGSGNNCLCKFKISS